MKTAVLQMLSGPRVEDNLAQAQDLLIRASEQGAQLVLLPENFALYGRGNLRAEAEAEAKGFGPILPFLAKSARELDMWLVGGTVPFLTGIDGLEAPEGKVYAGCGVWSPAGVMVGRYDKCHLFDAQVADGVGRYRESDHLVPGSQAVCVNTPRANLGLSVCYDLRFAEYFRVLRQRGAHLLLVPSAFTYSTGQAHWQTLLRARAIENQCFVVAANQGGEHLKGRATWGHSCIIDPWGRMLGECTEPGPGLVVAELDMTLLEKVRRDMPVEGHRRF